MVRLKVFYNNEFTEKLEDLELDSDFDNYDVRDMVFYNINAISIFKGKNSTEYALIHCNGEDFVCIDDFETVVNKFNQLTFINN